MIIAKALYAITKGARDNIMFLPNNNKKKNFVAISIKNSSVSYPPSAKLFCNLCSCNLVLADPQKEEWFCSRCSVS